LSRGWALVQGDGQSSGSGIKVKLRKDGNPKEAAAK
jgi:hypothetical protein